MADREYLHVLVTPLDIRQFSKYPVVDTYHPSVVYTENGWNDHRFWMAQTPYSAINNEPYPGRYELPCILFSDDGVKWIPISGNPIDDLSEKDIEAHNYLSDPHLILKNGRLELYYRYTILTDQQLFGNKTFLVRKTSSNGISWSEREIIADLRNEDDVQIWGEQIISPAIVWKDNLYYCWYVDASSYIAERHIRMTTSSDGIHWSKNVVCELPNSAVIPWHLDVQFYDGNFQLLLFDINNQTLTHYTSRDATTFSGYKLLLRPSHKIFDFYSNSVYRASSIIMGDLRYIYISGHNGERCSIGLWKTRDFTILTPIRSMRICTYISEYGILRKYYQALLCAIKQSAYRMLKKAGIL